jgi:Flp pilus assembly protein TadD
MSVTQQQITEWIGVGQSFMEAGRYADAALAFGRVQEALPGVAAIATMAGQAWELAHRTVEARAAYREVWRHGNRSDIGAVYDLGTRLLALGAPIEARECFDLVREKRPRDPAVWSALASATRAAGAPDAGWPLVEQALALGGEDPAFLLTAGQIRHAMGDLAGAAEWVARAAAMRPGHAGTRLQQAFTSLLGGVSRAGWELFEARPRPDVWPGTRDWQGEPLDGARLLVVCEQGFGDQFHFLRFLPRLAAAGTGDVMVACAPSLVGLLRANGIAAFAFDDVPSAEWSVPLLSLPHRLKLHVDMGGEGTPYLLAPNPASPDRSSSSGPLRLGLVWQGNPEFRATLLRDLDADSLALLAAVGGVEWISLQYGTDIPRGLPITAMPPCRDWADTADLLVTLDGVVSVDTSIAHLAGAMGIPTWILLPHAPDWRWGLEGESTAWYRSARLVRQPASLDWAGAIRHLHGLLSRLA